MSDMCPFIPGEQPIPSIEVWHSLLYRSGRKISLREPRGMLLGSGYRCRRTKQDAVIMSEQYEGD